MTGRADRCPNCQLAYGWDGARCRHCGYPAPARPVRARPLRGRMEWFGCVLALGLALAGIGWVLFAADWLFLLRAFCLIPAAGASGAALVSAYWLLAGRRRHWAGLLALKGAPESCPEAVRAAQEQFGRAARPCPHCGRAPPDLSWVYYSSPPNTWQRLCGRAGWMTLCESCRREVDFFLTIMN